MARWVDQKVLRLDVAMHDVVAVNVVESSEELISVQLDEEWVNLLI